jgi:protease PrsW
MTYLLALLVPCLAVLYYYYNRDRHREPWHLVALVFVAGALSTFVAVPLERAGQAWLRSYPSDHAGLDLLRECVLIPGCVEEGVKLLVVLAVVFWRREFDEPIDGLVYGTAAALGFAFAEDWRFYVLEGADWRRVLSAITHPWFSCLWASALGWARFRSTGRGLLLLAGGFLASATVHGVYDFLILASEANLEQGWLRHLLTPLLILLYFVMERRLDAARRHGGFGGASPAQTGSITRGEVVPPPAPAD